MADPIFKRSADTINLHAVLIATQVNHVVGYDKLSDAIGKPVTGSTGALRSARRIAQNEDRQVFGVIRSVGLKRLDDEGVIEFADEKTTRVRRGAWRARRVVAIADVSKLKATSRQRAIALASVLSVVVDLARERSLLTVGQATVGGSAGSLPIKATLRALGLST